MSFTLYTLSGYHHFNFFKCMKVCTLFQTLLTTYFMGTVFFQVIKKVYTKSYTHPPLFQCCVMVYVVYVFGGNLFFPEFISK